MTTETNLETISCALEKKVGRTKIEIQNEYLGVTAKLGELDWQLNSLSKEKKSLYEKIAKLHKEFAELGE